MKMFSTQLHGLFQKIVAEEEPLEDGARLLAQGPAGTGRIMIDATPELSGIAQTLASHKEAPERTVYFAEDRDRAALEEMDAADRVLLLAGRDEKQFLSKRIQALREKQVPLVVVAPFPEEEIDQELEFTDTWIQTPVRGGIIPDEKGNRVGEPSALCALFTGQVLYLYIKEILEEFD